MPSLLGAAAALYVLSTCLASTAGEQTSWIPQVWAVIMGALWVCVGVLAQGQRLRWISPITLYLLFCGWGLTGLIVTIDHAYFLIVMKTYLKIGLITWVISQSVKTRKDVLACLFCIVIASIVAAVLGRQEISKALNASRVVGDAAKVRANDTLLGNANYLGMFASLVILSGMTCLLCYRSMLIRATSSVGIVAGLYLVAASGSRTSMVGLAAGVVGMYFFHFRKVGRGQIGAKIIAVAVGMGMVAGTIVFISKLPFFYRLVEVFSSKEELMKEPRLRYIIIAMGVAIEKPLFGLGWGGFALHRLGRDAEGHGHYSHTSLAETLSTTGIPGFLFYFASLFALYRLIRSVRKLNLPKSDANMVNLIMAIYCSILAFNFIAIVDQHRLLWPLVGAFSAYLWNLRQLYGIDTPAVVRRYNPPRHPPQVQFQRPIRRT